jgi:hypothetical protein
LICRFRIAKKPAGHSALPVLLDPTFFADRPHYAQISTEHFIQYAEASMQNAQMRPLLFYTLQKAIPLQKVQFHDIIFMIVL